MATATATATSVLTDERWLRDHYEENYAMLRAIGRLFVAPGPSREELLDDQIQELFTTLWQKRAKLRMHPNIDGWLVEALRRQLKGQLRKAARRREKAPIAYADDLADRTLERMEQSAFPDPADALQGQERYELLVRILGRQNAAIFYAYCVLGYSARDLASRYQVSEGCIFTRVNRAKRRVLENGELFFMLMLAIILGL